MLPRFIRMVIGEIPTRSRAGVARGLIARANAARDARNYRIAASLYEEALRFCPHNSRVRIQCGHMLKEAGDLVGAEEQYELAATGLPNDADLALQIGHLHKLAGRPDKAKDSYARALKLSPGWREAEREFASVSGLESDEIEESPAADRPDWVVPELLPRGDDALPAVDRNILRLFRLGGRRVRSRWGDLKVLRGIECIRGYRLAPGPLSEIRLLIDGEIVHTQPLQAYPISDGSEPQTKYVFNIWHDFSAVAPGRHVIDLTFHDESGRRIRRHRETVLVASPKALHPDSDASVRVPPDSVSLDDAINALPSMVRTTERRLLPDPVRTILVQRVDQLGDLVCSVPAIRRLRELFPGARLVGLVTTANAPLAESLGLFDEIVAISFAESFIERRRTLGIEAQDKLRSALARFEFDLAIDLSHAEGASRAVLLLSGARFLYGFTDRLSPWLDAGLEFNGHDSINGLEVVPPSRKILLLVEGLAALKQDTARSLPNPDRTALAEFAVGGGEPYVVLHTGARLPYSRWPHFNALIELFLNRTDLKLIVFSDDVAEFEELEETALGNRLRLVKGQIPFKTFDNLLSHCALFIGNDSGPKHLAALRGAPVISLHMARLNWSEWGQEMSGRIISRRVPCAGCGIGLDGEDCGKEWACLRHIRPEEVFATAQELLKGGGPR